jgi:Putative zinc-finger
VKEPRPDDERLSALLDGRLTGRERDEVLAHLAADDEDYQVFVDTADVLREAEAGEDAAPRREESGARREEEGRIPPSLRPGARRWPGRAPRRIALAAAAAGLVVLAVLALRGRAAAPGDPVRLAGRLAYAERGLPEGWTERRTWSSARGGAATRREARAARAGALLVDLSVAVAARDSADTRLLATQLRERFDAQATSSSPIRQVSARAGEPSAALRPLVEKAAERLEARLGRDHLRLGAWTEAASLAAYRRDEAFFRSGDTRRMLGRAERLTAADPAARDALARVRAALPAEGAPDWDALTGTLDTLLGELAS